VKSRRDDPTIGVNCGHRVPRAPVALEGIVGKRYWCEECAAYRMSGGKSTGLDAFEFLFVLRDEAERHGVQVELEAEPTLRQRQVIEALGATLTVRQKIQRRRRST
jgi:hypothetical protein